MKETVLATLKVDERHIEKSCTLILTRVEEISERTYVGYTVAFCSKDDGKVYNVLVSSDREACRRRFISAAKTLIEKGKEDLLKELKGG